MAWDIGGLFAAIALGAFAYYRSRVPGGFYDAQIYGMTPAMHLRYAVVYLIFAVAFALVWVLHAHIEIIGLAAFTLSAIFYLSSFLRGAHEDDG